MSYFLDLFHRRINFLACILVTIVSLTKGKEVIYNITENLPPNTYLGNVAKDSEFTYAASNDSIRYSFLTGDNPNVLLFKINSSESSLYTSQRLDRENLCAFKELCIFNLEVIAQCQSGSCYDKIKVKVELIDLNDNYPLFPNRSLTLEFSEASVIGTSIPVKAAVDRDSGNYSVQNYYLQQTFPVIDSSLIPYFNVSFSGYVDTSLIYIVLNRKLDRETNDAYKIKVIAVDGGNPPKSGSMDITIIVTDINEFSPVFAQSVYNISVNEDIPANTPIVNVSATDLDQGDNGKITYRLSPNQDIRILTLFKINETTGEIKVNGSLIYEPGERYRIIVWASDQATTPLIGQAQVFVYVKDVHNNAPQISVNLLSTTGKAEISERASLGAAVAHIKINDPDHGKNGEVNCSLISDKFKLQIFIDDHEYKVVVAEPLNREVASRHTVKVICTDSGSPPKQSSTTFVVTVIDENDNVPVFPKHTYTVSIEENNPKGSSLLTVNAVDFDTGINSELRYVLNETQGYDFKIDPFSGLITADFSLDRENSSLISFEVLAIDGGDPPETGTTTVSVLVTDQNDNPPVFTSDNYVFSVLENMARNVSVGILFAVDADLGENKSIVFSIMPQYDSGIPFAVLPNGRIESTEVLDREIISKYHFSVVASDRGKPPLKSSAHVTINVLDTNDNSPEFLFPNSMNNTIVISFQIPPNTVFATIKARDPDHGENSKLYYSLRDRNVSHIFALNRITGGLSLLQALSSSDAKRYTFGVVVRDSGLQPKMTERALTIVVTARGLNGSLVADGQINNNNQYFLIAVAIACITVVLAVIILTAIFLIKRSDRKLSYCEYGYKDDKPRGGSGTATESEQKKSVSFSFKKTKPPQRQSNVSVAETITQNERNSFKISARGSPVASDSRLPEINHPEAVGSSNSPQNLRHLLHLQEIPNLSKNSKPPALNGILKRPPQVAVPDHHSDTSDETPSDSGKGGSEIDLNNSAVFTTYSSDKGNMKTNPSGQRKDMQQFLSKYRYKQQTAVNSPKEIQKSQQQKRQTSFPRTIPTNSIILKTYSDNKKPPPSLFIKKSIVHGNPGNSNLSSGHDDSTTTTSGSYILDHEADKYLELRQLSKQSVL